jgi:hypothetical protein
VPHEFPSLDSLRARLGPPPRKLGWFEEPPIAFPEPPWLKDVSVTDDPCKRVFANFKSLWKNGRVVWGRLIMANRTLFESGTNDAPGEVLYSLTADDQHAIDHLAPLVAKLWSLVTDPDPAAALTPSEAEWKEDLQTGTSFHAGVRLPETWQPVGHIYMASSPVFHRGHLPNGRIDSRFLPLLVNPEVPRLAMVIPHSFWPPGLHEWMLAHSGIEPEAPPPLPENHLEEREKIYATHLGPISSVFHETEVRESHIDVYCFDWLSTPRGEVAFVTGGMSDRDQPGVSGDFQRVELVFYAKQKALPFVELLRNFAHYPWETGAAIGPWHTFPLGDMAETALGTPRFPGLVLIPGTAKSERSIWEALTVNGQRVFFLTVFPITQAELDFSLENGSAALGELLTTKRFNIEFDPQRTSLV